MLSRYSKITRDIYHLHSEFELFIIKKKIEEA
jgi:hypothetical protein